MAMFFLFNIQYQIGKLSHMLDFTALIVIDSLN